MSIRRALAAATSALVAAALLVSPAQAAAGLSGLPSLRSPVTDENFYFVMADRFANGDTGNDRGGLPDDPLQSGFDPRRKGFYTAGICAGCWTASITSRAWAPPRSG